MKKHTLYTGIMASALFMASSLFFSACSDDDMFDSSTIVPTGEGIFFGTSIGNGQWTPDVIGRSAKEETQKPIVIEGEDGFSVTATVEDGIKLRNNEPKPQSRGTQVTQAAEVKAFDVAAYKNVNNTYEHYFTETVADGVNPSEKRFWPSKGTVDFIATYPQGIFSDQFPSATEYADGFSFNYTVKDNVEEQEDIMVACPKGLNNGQDGTAVPLQFQHLLAAVQFKVGKMQFIKINSITITGVKGGDVTISYKNGEWNYAANNENVSYSPVYTINNEPNIDTSGLPTGANITSNDNGLTMLVMPQELGTDAKIVVSYSNLLTEDPEEIKTANLNGGRWEAGKTTAYSLNINANNFDVTIPTPADQDAHYIILSMEYDLGELSSKISSVKAEARFLDDGTNTSNKSNITLKTVLSETQKQGFWTDESWLLKYTVEQGGTTDPENPVPVYEKNILGDKNINITNSNGVIYLLIEENNGYTDRNGELIFTAHVNETNQDIIIGKGSFKQLCPSWNGDSNTSIGVERFEDFKLNGETKIYPYGFSYDREVTYTNSLANANWGIFLDWLRQLILLFTGSTANELIPDSEGMAEGFVTINETSAWGRKIVSSITLNYNALTYVNTVADSTDGLENTTALYNFTGNTDISELENQLDEKIGGWNKTESGGDDEQPEDYAAFIALSRNRMRELRTEIKGKNEQQQDVTTIIYKAILHKEGENIDETGKDIIEWYLPSSEEAKTLVETGTGEEDTPISPLNGTYWSSTAGDDANAYAHSYTFTNNTFGSINESAGRMTPYKVRAVRKKP